MYVCMEGRRAGRAMLQFAIIANYFLNTIRCFSLEALNYYERYMYVVVGPDRL